MVRRWFIENKDYESPPTSETKTRVSFTFITRFFNSSLNHFSTRMREALLGPCFKTGEWNSFCQHLQCKCSPPPREVNGSSRHQVFEACLGMIAHFEKRVPCRGLHLERKIKFIFSHSSVQLPKVRMYWKTITRPTKFPQLVFTFFPAFWRVDWVIFDWTHADPLVKNSAHPRNTRFLEDRGES